jgi:hypothetical protein
LVLWLDVNTLNLKTVTVSFNDSAMVNRFFAEAVTSSIEDNCSSAEAATFWLCKDDTFKIEAIP